MLNFVLALIELFIAFVLMGVDLLISIVDFIFDLIESVFCRLSLPSPQNYRQEKSPCQDGK